MRPAAYPPMHLARAGSPHPELKLPPSALNPPHLQPPIPAHAPRKAASIAAWRPRKPRPPAPPRDERRLVVALQAELPLDAFELLHENHAPLLLHYLGLDLVWLNLGTYCKAQCERALMECTHAPVGRFTSGSGGTVRGGRAREPAVHAPRLRWLGSAHAARVWGAAAGPSALRTAANSNGGTSKAHLLPNVGLQPAELHLFLQQLQHQTGPFGGCCWSGLRVRTSTVTSRVGYAGGFGCQPPVAIQIYQPPE